MKGQNVDEAVVRRKRQIGVVDSNGERIAAWREKLHYSTEDYFQRNGRDQDDRIDYPIQQNCYVRECK